MKKWIISSFCRSFQSKSGLRKIPNSTSLIFGFAKYVSWKSCIAFSSTGRNNTPKLSIEKIFLMIWHQWSWTLLYCVFGYWHSQSCTILKIMIRWFLFFSLPRFSQRVLVNQFLILYDKIILLLGNRFYYSYRFSGLIFLIHHTILTAAFQEQSEIIFLYWFQVISVKHT